MQHFPEAGMKQCAQGLHELKSCTRRKHLQKALRFPTRQKYLKTRIAKNCPREKLEARLYWLCYLQTLWRSAHQLRRLQNREGLRMRKQKPKGTQGVRRAES